MATHLAIGIKDLKYELSQTLFHSGIRPGGNAPPGEALGPPGKFSPGGPKLKRFFETRS
jgi:hypothetical protein